MRQIIEAAGIMTLVTHIKYSICKETAALSPLIENSPLLEILLLDTQHGTFRGARVCCLVVLRGAQ